MLNDAFVNNELPSAVRSFTHSATLSRPFCSTPRVRELPTREEAEALAASVFGACVLENHVLPLNAETRIDVSSEGWLRWTNTSGSDDSDDDVRLFVRLSGELEHVQAYDGAASFLILHGLEVQP